MDTVIVSETSTDMPHETSLLFSLGWLLVEGVVMIAEAYV
jgi:hypothetical protein